MRISIGSDHAAFDLKEHLIGYLGIKGCEVCDEGPYDLSGPSKLGPDRVDYPDYASKVCKKITSGDADLGILLCGTGIGMSIAANKHKGIRAALCLFPEMAALARRHNDANVLVLGGRLLGKDLSEWITDEFLNNAFEKGRHSDRIEKILKLED